MSAYEDWLTKIGVELYTGGGIKWRLYQGALIPATQHPVYVELSSNEAELLLRESGAVFIRYANNPVDIETPWWFMICDIYDPTLFSSNMRRNVKRGYKDCRVEQIYADRLAEVGYECYRAAFRRYNHAIASDKQSFCKSIRDTVDASIFEYWGVYVDSTLVGYIQCIVENKMVALNIMKFHPDYLKYRSSYALFISLLKYYVAERGMVVSNGNRSIAHDTNMQDFLLKFGFYRQFCYLNIVYRPPIGVAVKLLYPFRGQISRLPDHSAVSKIQAILFQEQLRRECQSLN